MFSVGFCHIRKSLSGRLQREQHTVARIVNCFAEKCIRVVYSVEKSCFAVAFNESETESLFGIREVLVNYEKILQVVEVVELRRVAERKMIT